MIISLPPQPVPPVDVAVGFVRAGLPAEIADLGTFTWLPDRGVFHHSHGYFDKDEQGWVSYVDADIPEARLRELIAAAPVAGVRELLAYGYSACALDAWLRGDLQAVAYADAARAWQDSARVVAWRFAELYQALALDLAGRSDEARAALAPVDELTLWHAVATLFRYRSDVPHLATLWAIADHCRSSLGRHYATRLAEGEAKLVASGLPRERWRPAGYPGLAAVG